MLAKPGNEHERTQHMNMCIGCQLINQHRGERPWVTCYEHQERNVSAISKLLELYNYDKDAPNGNYPMIDGVVNLHSIVDDLASRYERGTLIAGEHRN